MDKSESKKLATIQCDEAKKKYEESLEKISPKLESLRSIIILDHIEDGPSHLQNELAKIFEKGVYYDKEGDFLEVSFGGPAKEGTTEEVEPGVFVTRDNKKKIITDIGILGFKKRVSILARVLKRFNMNFPLKIDISI